MNFKELLLKEQKDYLINHRDKYVEQTDNRYNDEAFVISTKLKKPIMIIGSKYDIQNEKSLYQLSRFIDGALDVHFASLDELEEFFDTASNREIMQEIYDIINEYGNSVICINGSWNWTKIPNSEITKIVTKLKKA